MPKPLINRPQQGAKTDVGLSLTPTRAAGTQQMSKVQLDRLLRKPRSKEYVEAMTKLDTGGHTCHQQQVDHMVQVIRNEFPDVDIQGVLIGIISICYLGRPYEVHTLDMTGSIITHYKAGQPLPGGMEDARGLAMHGGYACIEVYAECFRCISSTGAVSVVNR